MCESLYTKSCEFAIKAFNYLNTRVNRTRIPFFQLETAPNTNTVGHVVNGTMTLNIHNILELAKTFDKYDWANIRGLILITIIHELSHINQNIDYNRFSKDEAYHQKIELENHYNALNFMLNREEELHNLFGDYSDDICLDLELTQKCLENPQLKNSYKLRNTDDVAIVSLLNMFTGLKKSDRVKVEECLINSNQVFVTYKDNGDDSSYKYSEIVKDIKGIWYTYKIFNIIRFIFTLPAYRVNIVLEDNTDLYINLTRNDNGELSESAGQFVANIVTQ